MVGSTQVGELRVPPAATNPTVSVPLRGWDRTPAFTTVVCGVVGAERDDDAEAVVESYQVCEGCQVGHVDNPDRPP